MPRFPYFNMPFSYYRNQYRYPNSNNYSHMQPYSKPSDSTTSLPKVNSSIDTSYHNYSTEHKASFNNRKENKSNSNNLDYLFDLFGLKIFFDDALIVSLLFFLYTEGVKDDMLFIVLLLLLIS